jgi:2-polyprenyl-3-methyl-5-hydroxy-6-metoxy-1,4-benzoquinol methylase
MDNLLDNTEKFQETADIETSSPDYGTRFSGSVGRYFLETQSSLTLQLLAGHKTATILDVGGGHGQLARPLAGHGFAVTVTGSHDICGERLAKKMQELSYNYQTCDSLHLPFDDNAFHTVISFRLLPHADRWQQLIAELCRVARHSVILDYPDLRSFNILYRLLFTLKKAMEGNTRTYTMFNRTEIKTEFEKNSFMVSSFKPEFFWPMVLHRRLNNPSLSKGLELPARALGLTHLFGSPIIVQADAIPGPLEVNGPEEKAC